MTTASAEVSSVDCAPMPNETTEKVISPMAATWGQETRSPNTIRPSTALAASITPVCIVAVTATPTTLIAQMKRMLPTCVVNPMVSSAAISLHGGNVGRWRSGLPEQIDAEDGHADRRLHAVDPRRVALRRDTQRRQTLYAV